MRRSEVRRADGKMGSQEVSRMCETQVHRGPTRRDLCQVTRHSGQHSWVVGAQDPPLFQLQGRWLGRGLNSSSRSLLVIKGGVS